MPHREKQAVNPTVPQSNGDELLCEPCSFDFMAPPPEALLQSSLVELCDESERDVQCFTTPTAHISTSSVVRSPTAPAPSTHLHVAVVALILRSRSKCGRDFFVELTNATPFRTFREKVCEWLGTTTGRLVFFECGKCAHMLGPVSAVLKDEASFSAWARQDTACADTLPSLARTLFCNEIDGAAGGTEDDTCVPVYYFLSGEVADGHARLAYHPFVCSVPATPVGHGAVERCALAAHRLCARTYRQQTNLANCAAPFLFRFSGDTTDTAVFLDCSNELQGSVTEVPCCPCDCVAIVLPPIHVGDLVLFSSMSDAALSCFVSRVALAAGIVTVDVVEADTRTVHNQVCVLDLEPA